MRKSVAVAALALAAAGVVAPSAEASQPSGKVMAYFADWDVYARNYHVKDIETSGSAAKLTHINYAFGNVTGGGCAVGDPWADHDMPYDARPTAARCTAASTSSSS
jgi:chitinase